MKISKLYYPEIKEELYVIDNDALKIHVIPQKGYGTCHFTWSIRYGSVYDSLTIGDAPNGTAHFLEHILFKGKNRNLISRFAEMGCFANALTDFSHTSFFLKCTKFQLKQCIEAFIDHIFNPDFSNEAIVTERKIIEHEIMLYHDKAERRVFYNLLKGLYRNHPINSDILGSKDSIARINSQELERVYKRFYQPANMMLLIIGDIDINEIINLIDRRFQFNDTAICNPLTGLSWEKEINLNRIEVTMEISEPIINLGFKIDVEKIQLKSMIQEETIVIFILEMLTGEKSPLQQALINNNIISKKLDFNVLMDEGYGLSYIEAKSKFTNQLIEKFLEKVAEFDKAELDENRLERIKRLYARDFFKAVNSTDWLCQIFPYTCFKGVTVFDFFQIYRSISIDDIRRGFNQYFNLDYFAASIISSH